MAVAVLCNYQPEGTVAEAELFLHLIEQLLYLKARGGRRDEEAR